MKKEDREAYLEALRIVSALKDSMEHALRSDPDAVWKYSTYCHYMRKYNDVVRYVRGLAEIKAPIDLFNIDKVPHSGDTVALDRRQ